MEENVISGIWHAILTTMNILEQEFGVPRIGSNNPFQQRSSVLCKIKKNIFEGVL